ncbi:hypothetical protein [Streptomyces sp. GQFP]|uniref:hypothetical protein n=1 Tax=Streptomyces sp. GQFP TaxID=2907545 RepID=UPI001F2A224A|nr:hypothetical protein [Streptomyces sp. GQFP]UIX34316.1 hypothetical protein LUX31_32305 [Streptomyces sp. GQFP]
MSTEEMTEVRVEMTVTEEVTYDFPVTVEIPAEVADDPEAVTDYFAENEDLWLDDLPIDASRGSLSVNERDVEDVKLLPSTEAACSP